MLLCFLEPEGGHGEEEEEEEEEEEFFISQLQLLTRMPRAKEKKRWEDWVPHLIMET